MSKILFAVFLVLFILPGGSEAGAPKKSMLHLQSAAFKTGGTIPAKNACPGAGLSPELNWKGAPKATKSFAVVCEDPDAPERTWVHWVIFNIPAPPLTATRDTYELLEGFPKQEKQDNGILQGANDFGRIGYDGPCPPSRSTHRYYFELYALDQMLRLPAGISRDQLLKGMKGHLLAQTQIMGLFGR